MQRVTDWTAKTQEMVRIKDEGNMEEEKLEGGREIESGDVSARTYLLSVRAPRTFWTLFLETDSALPPPAPSLARPPTDPSTDCQTRQMNTLRERNGGSIRIQQAMQCEVAV